MTDKYIQEGDLILVEVSEGFYGYKVVRTLRGKTLLQISDRVGDCIYKQLPPGHYELIGKASELGEVECMLLVEDSQTHAKVWKDYTADEQYKWTAKESFLSLLKKHNLNPQTTIILKKKQ